MKFLVFASRRRLAGFVCGALAGFLLGAVPPGGAVELRLIAFNDFHGHLEAGDDSLMLRDPADPAATLKVPAGGAARLAGLIGRLRGEAPHSVVFSAGDLIGAAPLVSTLFRHESTIAVMNAIGLDFGIVGNHEFDAGITELKRIAQGGCADTRGNPNTSTCADGPYHGARFPILAANVEGPNGQPVLPPTFVTEVEGIRVGFIGVVTRSTPGIVMPSGITGLEFRDEAGTLNRYAAELRRQGVQAIVAVVHEGGGVEADWNDTACAGRSGAIFRIADKLAPAIDLVFSAHTHQGYNCVIDTPFQKNLRVIQGTSFGRAVSVIDVVLDPATRDIDRARTRSLNLPVVNAPDRLGRFAPVPTDPAVAALVEHYVALAAPRADQPVGRIAARIDRGPRDEDGARADFPAGRLVADAQLEATHAPADGGAQIAFTNIGGIRTALGCSGTPPCPVTYGQVFTMQPFGNTLVVLTLTGRQLKAVLEDQQKPGRDGPRFLQPSRGFSYTWKRGAAFGERVRDLRLAGRPVEPDGRYRVAVNSFLAEGGDGFRRLRDGRDPHGGVTDADALAAYLRRHDPYAPDAKARIAIVD